MLVHHRALSSPLLSILPSLHFCHPPCRNPFFTPVFSQIISLSLNTFSPLVPFLFHPCPKLLFSDVIKEAVLASPCISDLVTWTLLPLQGSFPQDVPGAPCQLSAKHCFLSCNSPMNCETWSFLTGLSATSNSFSLSHYSCFSPKHVTGQALNSLNLQANGEFGNYGVLCAHLLSKFLSCRV